MKFNGTKQLNPEVINTIAYDAVIVSSGYESRATYVIESVQPNAARKFVIGFDSHKEVLNREKNDLHFKKNHFAFFESDGNKSDVVLNLLDKIVDDVKSESLSIMIDYSCMTRVWYAAILQYFWQKSFKYNSINLVFAYAPSKFLHPPQEFILNRYVEPLDGFCNISIPDKPTALIIGLGHIPTRAFGLTEYFDAVPFLFYNDNSWNNKFSESVEQINRELLNAVHSENIFKYPLRNMLYTESLLLNLCKDLKDRFRVILAPCGPKPFTLISLIASLRLTEIDVWRISAGTHDIPMDKENDGYTLFYQLNFVRT